MPKSDSKIWYYVLAYFEVTRIPKFVVSNTSNFELSFHKTYRMGYPAMALNIQLLETFENLSYFVIIYFMFHVLPHSNRIILIYTNNFAIIYFFILGQVRYTSISHETKPNPEVYK